MKEKAIRVVSEFNTDLKLKVLEHFKLSKMVLKRAHIAEKSSIKSV